MSAEDWREWQAWRRATILDAQRARRTKYRRIDFYPTPEAEKIIDTAMLAEPVPAESTYAATISRIVTEWADFRNTSGMNRVRRT